MEFIEKLLDPDFYIQFIEILGPFGFLAGIGIAMVEAFIPPLPLALFVTINVIVFGFLYGYLLSYIGTIIGSYTVFLLIRKFGTRYMHSYVLKHPRAHSLFNWIHSKGVFPIFMLLTFPFTPSIVVCGLSAFAEIDKHKFLLALATGKLFMVLSLSFIGVSVQSFIEQPIRSIVYIVIILLVSLMGKKIMAKYESSVLRKQIHNTSLLHHHLKNSGNSENK